MKDKNDISVNKRIVELMKEKHISKSTLMKKVTVVSPSTVRGYIDSSANIPLHSLQEIAKALDVSTSFLLGEKETLQEREKLQRLLLEMKKIINIMSKIIESK